MGLIGRILDTYTSSRERTAFFFLSRGAAETISFETLIEKSLAYAKVYQQLGVKRDDVVSIVMKHSPDLYYAFLGAMFLKAIPTFLPTPSVKRNLEVYWRDYNELFLRIGVRTLVTNKEHIREVHEHVPDFALEILTPDEVRNHRFDVESLLREFGGSLDNDGRTVLLQHGSDTTALRKSVALSDEALMSHVDAYAALLGLSEASSIASWIPLYEGAGLFTGLILPLSLRIPTVVIDPFKWMMHPESLFEVIEKYHCTHVWLPNFAFHHLANVDLGERSFNLSSMQSFVSCSEPPRKESFDLFERTFSRFGIKREMLQTCYSMPEAAFAVAQTKPGSVVRALSADGELLTREGRFSPPRGKESECVILSSGVSIPGRSLRVLTPKGADVDADVVGQVVLQGKGLFTEFYKNPGLTSQRLRKGKFFTGDKGFFHDGELFLVGRLDDIIISYGKEHSAREIEQVLSRIEGLSPGKSIALGVYKEKIGSQEIVIISESENAKEVEVRKKTNRIKDTLQEFFSIPVSDVRVVPPEWIMRDSGGEFLREETREKYLRAFVKRS